MIEKPTILITSLGRTGTLFFANLFAELLPDGTSLHEPDYFNFGQYRGWKEKLQQARRQIQEAGFGNLVIKKSLGRWNLRTLSDARVCQKIPPATAARRILQQRQQFIAAQPGRVYVECSSAFYGLIDILPQVFRQQRTVYLVRDGREWVRSMLNFSAAVMYGKSWLRTRISPDWPTARELQDEPYASQWDTLPVFERLCWAWARLNGYALESIQHNPQARVFRFEDVFHPDGGAQHVQQLVAFATAFEPEIATALPAGGSGRQKVHAAGPGFPSWEHWPAGQKQQYERICGPLARQLGYAPDA
ncbi:MAG: sulfotransferase [Anaerolineales bacterium]|nr:sulfotransferase [Anaerolineales bacterium]